MFSFGCVIFEIHTGSYLLKYKFKLDDAIEKLEYCRAFTEGRIVRMKMEDKPWDNVHRMPLTYRASKAGSLSALIQGIVADRAQRLDAAQVLHHEALALERVKLASQGWKLDNGKKNSLVKYNRSIN